MTNKLKVTLLATLISATFVIPQAMADDQNGTLVGNQNSATGQSQRGERKKGHDRGAKIFKRLDSNEDGVLSLDEMTAVIAGKTEKVFTHKDSDEDGLLSLEEFSQNRRGERVDLSGIADEIVQCVTDLKAETGNEYINVPDADNFQSVGEKFAEVDSSADGFIDLAELQASKLAKTTAAFANMDSDDNGEVSSEEFKTQWKTHKTTKRAIHQCVSEIIDDEEG